MAKKIDIVFISHDSNITGAPILLKNLVELLITNNKYNINIILLRGGELEADFRKIAPTFIIKPKHYNYKTGFLNKQFRSLKYRFKRWSVMAIIKNADVIFSNTITNGNFLKHIKRYNKPVVSYVHELESIISTYHLGGKPKDTLQNSKLILCPSQAVAANLIENHNCSASKISFLPYYLPTSDSPLQEAWQFQQVNGNKFIKDENSFLVAGMGTANYRKGIDLFLETCRLVHKSDKSIKFVWVGDFFEEDIQEEINDKIEKYQLQDTFIITGYILPSASNLLPFDVFFLSSREDPYPLVVLEAALVNKPTIYFKGSGGIDELVDENIGWPIENFDIQDCANTILQIKNKRLIVDQKGKAAYEKVKSLHTNPELILQNFSQIIQTVIRNH